MITTFITPHTGTPMSIKIDDIVYIFHVRTYEYKGDFAPIIIEDTKTHNRYMSNGYITVNGHVFISKWVKQFNEDTGYWIYGTDIDIEVF